jgi:hypothetical protein
VRMRIFKWVALQRGRPDDQGRHLSLPGTPAGFRPTSSSAISSCRCSCALRQA